LVNLGILAQYITVHVANLEFWRLGPEQLIFALYNFAPFGHYIDSSDSMTPWTRVVFRFIAVIRGFHNPTQKSHH